MKSIYNKYFFIVILLFVCERGFANQNTQDSLVLFLEKNEDHLRNIVATYKTVRFSWMQFLVTCGGLIIILIVVWKTFFQSWMKDQIKAKAQAILENMTDLKDFKILVVSSIKGKNIKNDDFLKSFFSYKKFPNVKFIHLDKEIENIGDFEYDMVFVNNEDGFIDKAKVLEYTSGDTALFYFGKPPFDTGNLLNYNFANSRSQLYGNLMSSLEFLQCVKPKYRNV